MLGDRRNERGDYDGECDPDVLRPVDVRERKSGVQNERADEDLDYRIVQISEKLPQKPRALLWRERVFTEFLARTRDLVLCETA